VYYLLSEKTEWTNSSIGCSLDVSSSKYSMEPWGYNYKLLWFMHSRGRVN